MQPRQLRFLGEQAGGPPVPGHPPKKENTGEKQANLDAQQRQLACCSAVPGHDQQADTADPHQAHGRDHVPASTVTERHQEFLAFADVLEKLRYAWVQHEQAIEDRTEPGGAGQSMQEQQGRTQKLRQVHCGCPPSRNSNVAWRANRPPDQHSSHCILHSRIGTVAGVQS